MILAFSGNVYDCCGGVLELNPLNGGWNYSELYDFPVIESPEGAPGQA
jgi:hypothetical protein